MPALHIAVIAANADLEGEEMCDPLGSNVPLFAASDSAWPNTHLAAAAESYVYAQLAFLLFVQRRVAANETTALPGGRQLLIVAVPSGHSFYGAAPHPPQKVAPPPQAHAPQDRTPPGRPETSSFGSLTVVTRPSGEI